MVIAREVDPQGDDRPPVTQFDTPESYVEQRTRELDQDVLQGLRELDGADTVRWSVSRTGDEDPSRNGFLVKLNTSQLSAEYIRNRFGGGKYYVRGMYPNGGYAGHRTLDIAFDAPRTASTGVGVSAGAGTGFDVQRFMAEQDAREEARAEKRRRERLEILQIVGPIAAPIIAAMVGRQGPDISQLVTALKGPTMPEMMTALASLKSLAPEQTTDPIDRALKLLDVIQDKAPSGGETGWLDVVKEVIRAAGPTVGTVIEGAVQSAMTRVSPTSTTPAAAPSGLLPAPSAAPGGSVSATPQENPQMLGLLALIPWLKQQLEMAIQKASRGSDPVLIAERILDDLPDSADPEQLLAFVQREDWWAQLQRLDARVSPYAQWFARMRQAMLEQFTGLSGETEVETGAPGNVTTGPSPQMTVTEIERPAGPPSLTGK